MTQVTKGHGRGVRSALMVSAVAVALSGCGTPLATEVAAGPGPRTASIGPQFQELTQIEQIRFQQAIRSAQLRRPASEAAVETLRAAQQVTSDSLRAGSRPTVQEIQQHRAQEMVEYYEKNWQAD